MRLSSLSSFVAAPKTPHLQSPAVQPLFASGKTDTFHRTRSFIPPPVFHKSEAPLLAPNPASDWEIHVFNPSVVKDPNGGYHMLYRAHQSKKNDATWPYVSYIGYAHLDKSGKKVDKRKAEPVITLDVRQFPHGAEDPRITQVGDTYYIFLNASNRHAIRFENLYAPTKINLYSAECKAKPQVKGQHELERKERVAIRQNQLQLRGANIYLVTTRDFRHFKHVGVIGPEAYDKNSFMHPEPVNRNGKPFWMLYHRIFPDIQFVFSKDVKALKDTDFWEKQLRPESLSKNTLMKPLFEWESSSIGASSPPIKTDAGWLLIYQASGLNTRTMEKSYTAGAVLLDLDDPTRVLSRSPMPILKPELPAEKAGVFPNVLVSTGAVRKENELLIYYGSGDQECRVASCDLSKLLTYLQQFDTQGIVKPKANSN